ncbi:MAG: TonB-dependent receptor [Bacteroidia bacterium]|nr:TonB-dependent receptor [Bacteroidia bacterium]
MKKILLTIFMVGVMGLPYLLAKSNPLPLVLKDAQTGEVLVGASISFGKSKKLLFSDVLGKVYIPGQDENQISLRVELLGYHPRVFTLSLDQSRESPFLISLEPKSISIEEVNITASNGKLLSPLKALDLQLRPLNSSQDILRQVPGLSIAQHAGGGKAEQIFLRGFDLDHGTDIQINVDGLPVNMVSHAHGQGYADLHFLIPETVERLDFGKGPYDAEKGNFATAAFVDFQTKNALDKSLAKIEIGQFNTIRSLLMSDLSPKSNKTQAYVAAEFLGTDGYFDASQDMRRVNLFGKFSRSLGQNSLLRLSASHFQSSWNASGQIPGRAITRGEIGYFGAIDSTEGGSTSRQNVNAQFFHSFNENASLQSQVYFSRLSFDLFSNFTFFLEDPENGDQIQQTEKRDILGVNLKYSYKNENGRFPSKTDLGFNLRLDQIGDLGLFHTKNRIQILEELANGEVQELNAAFFVNHQVNLGRKLKFNAGLRLDQFTFSYSDFLNENAIKQSQQKLLPSAKLRLQYSPITKLLFYVHAGTGFHSNDSRVVLANQPSSILPVAYGLDLGFIFKPIKNVFLQAAIWGLDLEEEFVYVGDAGIVEPSGKSRRMGVDISSRIQLKPYLFVDSDVNVTHPRSLENEPGEDFIPLAPIWSASNGLTLKTNKNLSGSLRHRFLGDRPANEDYSLTAEGYHLFDFVGQYQHDSFQIQLSIENIFNVKWKEAQFETTSLLQSESAAVTEVHFTPGTPFFAKLGFTVFW